jgi:hypothetical protein
MSLNSNSASFHYNKINDTMLWDCRDFIKNISTDRYFKVNSSLTEINQDLISTNKIKFNVKSTIFEKAKSIDIIKAWNYCNTFLPIEKFLPIFLVDYILKIKRRPRADFEPYIIELVRLVYWINQCSKFDNFNYKIDEIKCKLGKGLLKNFDKYKFLNAIDDDTINNELNILYKKQKLQQFTDKEKKQFANYLKNWFKESFGFNSELMAAFLSSEAGFKVQFDKFNQYNHEFWNHDYDFIIETFPVQVKSYIIYRRHSEVNEELWSKGLEKERYHLEKIKQIKQDHLDNNLTWNQVKNEVKKSIKSNQDEFIKAINKQKTKIIIYNGTQSTGGYALSLFTLEKNVNSYFIKNIEKSIKIISNLENKNIPLIFFSSGYYIKYYITSLCFKLPCIDNQFQIDNSSIDRLELV